MSIPTDRGRIDPALVILPGIVALGLLALLIRLWFLQVVRGSELSALADRRTTIRVLVPAPRGQILDRQGNTIATVEPSLTVSVRPTDIAGNHAAIERLAIILGESTADIEAKVKENSYRRSLPFPLRQGITAEQAIAIEEERAFLPGVTVGRSFRRSYPHGAEAAHVVGYIGGLSEEDIDRIRDAGREDLPNFVGKVGLERRYDIDLLGTPGEVRVEVDRRGRQLSEMVTAPPIPGSRMITTIDLDLQEAALRALAGRRGAVVALEPKTGEVLCLTSSPAFDPSLFGQKISNSTWTALQNDSRLPFLNRASGAAFPPGSTFKPAVLIAAVREGIVSPGTTFVCDGDIRVGDRTFRCLGSHGRINYETAIEKSCNVFFAEVGRRINREGVVSVAEEFGLGKKTGIDLLTERSGLIPDDEWRKSNQVKWYVGDTINLCIGQGYILVTPLQLAECASIIANRGIGYMPHLIQRQTPFGKDTKITKPETAFTVTLDPQWWERIVSAMVRVVSYGTGSAAQLSGIAVAGKTGSADVSGNERAHAWFLGFAPANDPKIAIAVVVEAGGRGGEEAAPIARSVISKYLTRINSR